MKVMFNKRLMYSTVEREKDESHFILKIYRRILCYCFGKMKYDTFRKLFSDFDLFYTFIVITIHLHNNNNT